MFNVPQMHVLEVVHERTRTIVTVETDQVLTGCPACGVVAVGHGRRSHRLADALAAPRAKLTRRAVTWATDALVWDDTTVAALARHLGVDWHTCWDAIETEATKGLADPDRLAGVGTLGVDEYIWKPSRHGADRAVTSMVDLTRDQYGRTRARLLDVVPGRAGTAYARWLKAQGEDFTVSVEHAALDPFRGYANAIRDELPDAVAVLDAFHVVKLGTRVVDEVRRRVQQDTLGRRGHKDDPLCKVRGLLRHGTEHLTPRQATRLEDGLQAGDPDFEVTVAWHCYQPLPPAGDAPRTRALACRDRRISPAPRHRPSAHRTSWRQRGPADVWHLAVSAAPATRVASTAVRRASPGDDLPSRAGRVERHAIPRSVRGGVPRSAVHVTVVR